MRMKAWLLLLLCGVSNAQAGERIVETASGRILSEEELLVTLRAADVVLLGERHDNPLHHQRRGALLARLPAAAVVAEQLPRQGLVHYEGVLEVALTAAGFDAQQWRWPLYAPLFVPLAERSIPLFGGNLPVADVRRIAAAGTLVSLPRELAEVLAAAPLSPPAQVSLDADLLQGHCGYLPAERLPGLRLAQRTRDVAMFVTLRSLHVSPLVLVAGNGHVRADYGVPVLFDKLLPGRRLVSVGLIEENDAETLESFSHRYSYVWITAPARRDDPCKSFRKEKR